VDKRFFCEIAKRLKSLRRIFGSGKNRRKLDWFVHGEALAGDSGPWRVFRNCGGVNRIARPIHHASRGPSRGKILRV
jgi:hypothetical protein